MERPGVAEKEGEEGGWQARREGGGSANVKIRADAGQLGELGHPRSTHYRRTSSNDAQHHHCAC